jgi:hypothetical protein
VADDGDEIAMRACPDAQHAEATLVTRSTVPASTARSGWVEGCGADMG